MTKIRFAAATCAALAALATAPAMAQTSDWTGFYVGGSAGYAEPESNDGETLVFDTNRDGTFNDTVRTSATGPDAFGPGFCGGAAIGRTPGEGCRTTDGNLSLSLRAGYDWQFGPWVVGVVGEAAKARIGNDVSGFSTTPASYTFTRDLDYTLAARARAGYAFDNYLVYATGGMAWGELDRSFTTTNTANSFTPSGDDDATGYQLGAGVDMMWSENMTIGLEYLRTSLEDDEYVVDVGPGTAGLTNPFRVVNPAGTFTRRTEDKFEYDTVSVTAAWRW